MKHKPLRIAQISPIAERVPPEKYGGTERVVSTLTEELVKRGHKVTLFASGDSKTQAKLVSVYPRGLRGAKVKDTYGTNIHTLLNIGAAYQRQDEFDIIHDHNSFLSLPTANLAHVPVLMTIHGPITVNIRKNFETLRNPHLVAISDSQRESAPNLNWTGMIHHGLDFKNFPFSETTEGYLLFVGRISMEKGVHFAIETAQYLDLPLIIAAKLEGFDTQYFNEYVGPMLSNGQIKWVGEVDQDERNRLMSKALCFLHPVTWKEPFGLTLIESMACGCPVIGFNKGSIPEVIRNGKTGFVVEDVEEMAEAVNNIKKIERIFCRDYARENFNSKLMTDNYEKIYYQILENKKN